MTTIKGNYYYKNRTYQYETQVLDVEDYRTTYYSLKITNEKGEVRHTVWHFKWRGLEEEIRLYVEAQKTAKLPKWAVR